MYLLSVELERSTALARGTHSGLHLLILPLYERSDHVSTSGTVELHHRELWKDAGGHRHNTADLKRALKRVVLLRSADLHKHVEVDLPELADLLVEHVSLDAHLHFRRHACIVRKHRKDDRRKRPVKALEHLHRCVRQEESDVLLSLLQFRGYE